MRNKTRIRIFASMMALGLLPSPSQGSDYSFPTGMKVTIERGETPIYQNDSNVIYPILSYFSVNWPNGATEFFLMKDDGEELRSSAITDRYLLEKTVSVGDRVNFAESAQSPVKPIRVVLSGPIDIGHIHFKLGSAALTDDAKTVLTQVAGQMKAAGLNGAYLVGTADRAGSKKANLALAKLRADRAAKFLTTALAEIDVLSPKIITEFMGEYLAVEKDGRTSYLDRKVTLLLYPNRY